MCGIVGILGTGPVAGSIVDALKRLEYRGYDSAGVATLENGKLARRRAEGKLKNLEAKLAAARCWGCRCAMSSIDAPALVARGQCDRRQLLFDRHATGRLAQHLVGQRDPGRH